jgi:hypothetical protein
MLGAGSEGPAPNSEGPSGGSHGPVVSESGADLRFGKLVAAIRSPPARGYADASESGLHTVTGHPGGFGQGLERFAGLVPPAELVVIHGPQCDRSGR